MRKAAHVFSFLVVFFVSISAYESFLNGAQSAPPNMQLHGSTSPQTIHGTTYDNKTAHFTLTVPKDWVVGDALMKQIPGIIGALSAPGGAAAIMIQRYYVPGPKEGVKFLDAQYKNGFQDYHKLSEAPIKIDGKDAYSFTVHAVFAFGPPEKPAQIPAKLFIVLIPDGESVLGFTCQAPESVFAAIEPTLNKIVTSFHRNPQ